MRTHLLFILLLLSVGCGRDGAFENIDTNTPVVSDIPDGKPMAYPKLYVDNGLPEYPGAILTDLGTQTTSLQDGLRVTAVSNDSMGLVMPFYIEAMEKLGYTYDKAEYERSKLVADAPMTVLGFQKEKLGFTVMLSKLEEQQTQIKTSFTEG